MHKTLEAALEAAKADAAKNGRVFVYRSVAGYETSYAKPNVLRAWLVYPDGTVSEGKFLQVR